MNNKTKTLPNKTNQISSFLEESIKLATGASQVIQKDCLQILWSGYGKILRYELINANIQNQNVIVKYINLPDQTNHPRGWNTPVSHQRKLTSYEVETSWYQQFNQLNKNAVTAKCYGVFVRDNERVIVLDDLDELGFDIRLNEAKHEEILWVIKWLASFHASHLIHQPIAEQYDSLWNIGTYWHLGTRPDEYEAMQDKALKNCAHKIDQLLNECPIQTLVHGDAKLANFCFDIQSKKVAGVDFQYIGKGVGVKDLAYFLGGCFTDEFYEQDNCGQVIDQFVGEYFKQLEIFIEDRDQFKQTEKLWRELFNVAWVDFQRFVKGWSPDHWKINTYSENLTQQVIKKL